MALTEGVGEMNPVIYTNSGNHRNYDQVEDIEVKTKNDHNAGQRGQTDNKG